MVYKIISLLFTIIESTLIIGNNNNKDYSLYW